MDEDGWPVCDVFAAADSAAGGTAIELVSPSLLFEGVEEAAEVVEIDVLALVLEVPAAVLDATVVETAAVGAAAAAAVEVTVMALDEEGMVGPFVDDDQVPVLLSNFRPWAF